MNDLSDLAIIKTSLNEVILAELYTSDDNNYVMLNPYIIIMESDHSAGIPFIFGTDQIDFSVPISYIISHAKPNKFMSRFYGSLLWRSEIKSFLNTSPELEFTSQAELDRHMDKVLSLIKTEIINKFGMLNLPVNDEETNPPEVYSTDKVLH